MKVTRIGFFAIVFLLAKPFLAVAQNFGEIVRLDPVADAIVSGDEVVERIGDGLNFWKGRCGSLPIIKVICSSATFPRT